MNNYHPITGCKYIGFWLRSLATFIDIIILTLITTPLLVTIYGWAYFESGKLIKGPMDILVSWVLPTVAVILLWIYKSATPGKMIISAQIVDAKTGRQPSGVQFTIRYFAYIISTLPIFMGFVMIAFDEKKQAWHDKVAGTVVVRSKK